MLQEKGNWNNLTQSELSDKSGSYFMLNFSWWLSPVQWRPLVHLRWRVSAGPRLKASGNSPQAARMRLSGSRNQCLALMEGALPIKCSTRLLLMMTRRWGQYEKSVRCGTIDSLNQDPYRNAAQDVAAWWCGESSPWVPSLKGWKRIWHELIGEATASRLCHMDQITISFPNEGACGWWITEIALSYYYIGSLWYN